MIKVYFEEKQTLPAVPLIASYSKYDAFYKNAPFLKRAFEALSETFVERVPRPEDADFIVLPYMYEHLLEKQDYVEEVRACARNNHKKLLVFIATDFEFIIDWPEAIVFRTSAYRSTLRPHEFIMPPVVEDLLGGRTLSIRTLPQKPTVGFVGWAGFASYKQALRSRIKDLYTRFVWCMEGKHNGHRRKGVFLRLELIRLLSKAKEVSCHFIIRDSYSGSMKANPTLDVATARKEYVDNIEQTDMTLAVRGDGNFSQRFYECLSLGRMPLFIDTDAVLPLEDIIPYHRFVIRVPYTDRKATSQYIERFFNGLSEEEYTKRQQEARDTYVRYLSTLGFYRYLFKEEHIRQYLSPELLRT